jgi:hypothetical protein
VRSVSRLRERFGASPAVRTLPAKVVNPQRVR